LAFAAGRRIAGGSRARADFDAIFEWKTRGRGRSRPALNGDDELADALDLASAARTERAAIAVLTGLSGVDIPVASAVMTAGPPERYTVIDVRALWSLGVERVPYHSVVYYPPYPKACRSIAAMAGAYLRTLDRALSRYSSDHQPQRRLTPSRSTTGKDVLHRQKWPEAQITPI
jgi:hypothetical protein